MEDGRRPGNKGFEPRDTDSNSISATSVNHQSHRLGQSQGQAPSSSLNNQLKPPVNQQRHSLLNQQSQHRSFNRNDSNHFVFQNPVFTSSAPSFISPLPPHSSSSTTSLISTSPSVSEHLHQDQHSFHNHNSFNRTISNPHSNFQFQPVNPQQHLYQQQRPNHQPRSQSHFYSYSHSSQFPSFNDAQASPSPSQSPSFNHLEPANQSHNDPAGPSPSWSSSQLQTTPPSASFYSPGTALSTLSETSLHIGSNQSPGSSSSLTLSPHGQQSNSSNPHPLRTPNSAQSALPSFVTSRPSFNSSGYDHIPVSPRGNSFRFEGELLKPQPSRQVRPVQNRRASWKPQVGTHPSDDLDSSVKKGKRRATEASFQFDSNDQTSSSRRPSAVAPFFNSSLWFDGNDFESTEGSSSTTRSSTRTGSLTTARSSLSDLSDLDLAAAAFCSFDSDDSEEDKEEEEKNGITLSKKIDLTYARKSWFDHLLSFFSLTPRGGNASSLRIVETLLGSFLQSNAIFFCMFHAPTLMESIRDSKNREQAHPALYFAILAVTICDFQKPPRSEPWTGTLEEGISPDGSSRLTLALREASISYLESSLSSDEPLSISLIQAASVLCILEPKRSPRKDRLLSIIEGSITALKIPELIKDPPDFIQAYYSLPPKRESMEMELKCETAVRVCWAPTSHKLRLFILEPDSNELDSLPDYLGDLRPIRFWSPSSLPDRTQLPAKFFRSQDVMLVSAQTARVAFTVGGIKMKEKDGGGRGRRFAERSEIDGSTLGEACKAMKQLDEQEYDIDRLYTALELEPDLSNSLKSTLDMNVRVSIGTRCLLWRKTGLWSEFKANRNRNLTEEGFENVGNHLSERSDDKSLPTLKKWLEIVEDFVDQLDKSVEDYQIQIGNYNQPQQQQQQQQQQTSPASFHQSNQDQTSNLIPIPKLSTTLSELNSFSSHLNLLSQIKFCVGKGSNENGKLQNLHHRLGLAIGKHLEIRKKTSFSNSNSNSHFNLNTHSVGIPYRGSI